MYRKRALKVLLRTALGLFAGGVEGGVLKRATHPLRNAEKVPKPSNPTFSLPDNMILPTVISLFGEGFECHAPRGATHPLRNVEKVPKPSNLTFVVYRKRALKVLLRTVLGLFAGFFSGSILKGATHPLRNVEKVPKPSNLTFMSTTCVFLADRVELTLERFRTRCSARSYASSPQC